MDEEVSESWEEAADSGVINERLNISSVQANAVLVAFFVLPWLFFRSSKNVVLC